MDVEIRLDDGGGGVIEETPTEKDDDDDDEDDEDEDEIFNFNDRRKKAPETALESGAGLYMADAEVDLVARAPVVTIMGHVDHGKTSLLDAIRQTSVASGEAGGITQGVSAYQVTTESGKLVTFLDTPGHAAFSEMRQRGADCTDVVVLVVAADDGVMAQTTDSLAAARQAGKPVVVAFNKVDKEGADVPRVAGALAGFGLLTESLGGEILAAEVSAKQKTGLDDLLEKILLQAEVLDLKANPTAPASGVVLEARQEMGLGAVATVLIQRGTLRVGDDFIAGGCSGKVRSLRNENGEPLAEAEPSQPCLVAGLDGIPKAGDLFLVGDDRTVLRDLAEARMKLAREKTASKFDADMRARNLKALSAGAQKELKEINVVIKADVQGSAEALASSLAALLKEDNVGAVQVKVLFAGVGDVSQSDVALAGVSGAWVIGFNVAATFQAMEDARVRGLELGYYNVVYDVLDEMERRMEKVLSPTPDGELVGKATVKEIFDIGKVGKIAGSGVLEGKMLKAGTVRVMRGDRIVHEGKLKTLKSFKANVPEVESGNDCGINFFDWEEMEVGDVVECYALVA